MKEVFLIGDSIRMAYEPAVRELLGDRCSVKAPKDNTRFAAYVLNSLRFWNESLCKADVIHFNVGLWDIARIYLSDGCFTPIEWYMDSLTKIVRELKKFQAKLIFATTTPCRPEKEMLTGPLPPRILNADVVRYNEAALALMAREGVEVDDLYSLVAPHIGAYISDDLIHPNEMGRQVLAKAVSEKIWEVIQ